MSEELLDLDEILNEVELIQEAEKTKRKKKSKNKKKVEVSLGLKYLIVMDFEATCWEKPYGRGKPQEIIEFPACLLNLTTGEIEKEFQYYTKPIEQPELSDYCKNLTGISQSTVDSGIDIRDCIDYFIIWVKEVIKEKELIMPKTKRSNLDGNCALVTWGNWDFLICLQRECHRKKIRKPSIFNQWIDLKEIYIERYKRKDKFTFGDALNESGIEFIGQAHSGLCDARMTCALSWKMHKDKAFLRITKDLNQHELNRAF
ncbi:unnamed protein product [Diamesa serratosioi]